ncbi:hypothetical protein ABT095_18090 [Kitasatospora sp. NPDC002227]|uniref:hypothetical protein n=1 Tax=Kitasatospora sp. NPDC002227 TaxID=3154773 RepID=UPI00331B7C52
MFKHKKTHDEVKLQASAQLMTWHWYSQDQVLAAAMFSRKCGEMEANRATPTDDEKRRGLTWAEAEQTEHRSYVVASVLASVAFLEASLNELFASAPHENLEVGGGRGALSAGERRSLTDLTGMLDRNDFLDKFQLVLHLLGKQPFDRGAQPYQDAQLLVQLRNVLVHYKPRWRPGGDDSGQSIQASGLTKGLADRKFSLNPFTGQGNPFFPDKCLGHGCTTWALTAALDFADGFFARLGVTPVYQGVRGRLAP